MRKQKENVIHMYFKHRWRIAVMLAVFVIVTLTVFFLYSQTMEPLIYTFELNGVFLIFVIIGDFIRFYKKHDQLNAILNLESIYQTPFPDPQNQIELDYQDITAKTIDEITFLRDQNAKSMSELKDYYAIWAHQIKTPISAVDLILQVMNEDTLDRDKRELKNQMFQIDFYVDAVMNYLRLDDMSSDFQFAEYSIESIVKKTIKKFASQFIRKKISVELDELDKSVVTDEKWLGFILEQLISNAIKYTKPEGQIRIYLKETFNVNDRILVIEDNGIGIEEEDLPRIFECGYTGYNGRMNKKSSGIGLYLSKKAADKLGNTISIESKVDQGTKVLINLTQYHTQHE